jgi:hypothetical protein
MNADEKRGQEAYSLAQVRPGNLVDSEEWEVNYHDQKLQLNEQRVWDRQVWGEKLDANADKKRGHDKEGEANSLAQVRPGNLVDSEEWEADFHDQKAQLNKQRVRDRHMWGEKLDANVDEKSGSGSTPTRGEANLCPVPQGSLVKRVHDEEGEANSLAYVCPGDLVYSEEWEADYHDQKLQLNEKRVRDRHVLGEKLDADADEKSGSRSTPTRSDANSCLGGPSRLAPAQQTRSRLEGSKVERPFDRGRQNKLKGSSKRTFFARSYLNSCVTCLCMILVTKCHPFICREKFVML